MTNNYTPGPWEIRAGERNTVYAKGIEVAVATRAEIGQIPRAAANACLIAAAPDMLAALKLAQFAFGFGSSATLQQQQEAAEAITSAILKAEERA